MDSQPTIHKAAWDGDIERVRQCIDEDPSCVNSADEHGWYPVYIAGLCKNEPLVRLLIDAGADLSLGDGYVMHFAGEIPGNKPIVKLLIEYGALDAHVKPSSDLARQFIAAVFIADLPRVRAMIRLYPDLIHTRDGRDDLPIHHAARNGDLEIVQAMIDAAVDVNQRASGGTTTLYCAGGHGHVAVVKALLEAGADKDAVFTEDGKNLAAWLDQYPDDKRYQRVRAALDASDA